MLCKTRTRRILFSKAPVLQLLQARIAMMKFLAQVIVVALSLGQLSQALPQGGMAIPNHAMICDDARSRGRQAYRNIKETTYDGPVELATGQSCRSSAGDGCSITKAYTWSK